MESIPSPYNQSVISRDVMKKVQAMTGHACVFIVTSDEIPDHECVPGACKGHVMNINTEGFTPQQILSIASILAQEAGMKLVPKITEDLL